MNIVPRVDRAMGGMAKEYTGFLGVLYDWQDLIGALASTMVAAVAIIVSIAALRAAKAQVELGRKQLDLVRQHEADRREARRNAVRAALNPTLSNLCFWAEGVAYSLRALPVRASIPREAREEFAPPRVGDSDLAVIFSVIEGEDDADVRRRLNRMISNIQVLTSRLALISNLKKRVSTTAEDVDSYLLDAAIIYAQASSCFSYARRRTDTVSPLTWDNVDNAMMSLSFHGQRFCKLIKYSARRRDLRPDPERLYDE